MFLQACRKENAIKYYLLAIHTYESVHKTVFVAITDKAINGARFTIQHYPVLVLPILTVRIYGSRLFKCRKLSIKFWAVVSRHGKQFYTIDPQVECFIRDVLYMFTCLGGGRGIYFKFHISSGTGLRRHGTVDVISSRGFEFAFQLRVYRQCSQL